MPCGCPDETCRMIWRLPSNWRGPQTGDELCKAPDLSAMEAVAVVMTVDFEAALRLLCELPRRTSSCGKLGQEPPAG